MTDQQRVEIAIQSLNELIDEHGDELPESAKIEIESVVNNLRRLIGDGDGCRVKTKVLGVDETPEHPGCKWSLVGSPIVVGDGGASRTKLVLYVWERKP